MVIKSYTGIEQFDFQILRFTVELAKRYPAVEQDLTEIGHLIYDFESWYVWWTEKAKQYDKDGQLELAMTYYRASLFYLDLSDPRKEAAYQDYRSCFDRLNEDEGLRNFEIPYKTASLPAILLEKEGATKTFLIFGGFDSYLEELTTWFLPLRDQLNYHFLIFDGPGQGHVTSRGLYYQYDYEKAVSAVLDYFNLEEVDAVGISWGGYFVLRAAAFEKRIKRCICFDIFYSGMDTLQMQSTALEFFLLKMGLRWHQKELINHIIAHRAKGNINLQWMLQQGMNITGEKNAYDFIKNIARHDIGSLVNRIDQPCLLLAGSQDMYVPTWRLEDLAKKLSHSPKVETKRFTEETGGVLHCQLDKIDLALDAIVAFLKR